MGGACEYSFFFTFFRVLKCCLDCTVPVFTRPAPTTRSRSSTCTSSSGGDTPPLSSSDGSSNSGGSQSSIDLSQIDFALSNATHPLSTVARTRARTRGTGHRRRYSKSHISRSSVYETIEEERSNPSSPAQSLLSKKSSPTTRQPVFIVDSDTVSIHSKPEESTWDDEHGITTLRKYYALRDEAENVVVESKRTWLDTPFSLFALQSTIVTFVSLLLLLFTNSLISFPSTRKSSRDASTFRTFCAKLPPITF